jgi:HEAT repeat protein
MRRRTAVAFLVATLVASASVFADEPFWNQRPLGYWLNQLRIGDTSAREQAARGVKEMAAEHGSASVAAAVPLLVPCLDAPDAPLRVAAADALGPIGAVADPASPRLLALFEKDPDPAVRRAAGMAAGQIRPGSEALVSAAGRVLSGDDDAGVRQTAAALLVESGTAARSVSAAAHTGLADRDATVRVYAAAVVGRLGDSATAIPVLLQGLAGPEGAVRAESAGLLADTAPADARVVPALIASLRDDDRRVRLAAADALGVIGPPAITAAEPLWRLIHDPDEDVRDHALKALRLIKE